MIKDLFDIAIINLKHRKLRSWLTIIGVVIGIATISSLYSLNQGLYSAIYQQFEMMGTNTIIVFPGSGASISPILSMLGSYLQDSDANLVENVRGVDYVIPALYKATKIKYKTETSNVFVYAIPSDKGDKFLEAFHGMSILEGRRFNKGDKYKVILGYRIAKDAFSDEIGVGSNLEINGKKFKVIGILSEIGNRMDDNSISIPLETAREIFGEKGYINMMFVKVKSGYDVQDVAERIKFKLKNAHGKEDFQVLTSADLLKRAGQILGLLSIVTLGIAAISLFVGAIGIMNTMYMAVIERTREIGIMKSIGAKNRDILSLFLLESGLIGLTGGVIGLSLGLLLAKVVEIVARKSLQSNIMRMAITPEVIIISLGISLLVGILSGLLPARSAAKLNPVDALRYE